MMFKPALTVLVLTAMGLNGREPPDPKSRNFTKEVLAAAKEYLRNGDPAGAKAYLMVGELMQERANVPAISRIPLLLELDVLYQQNEEKPNRELVRTKLFQDWKAAVGDDELVVANSCERLASILASEGKTAEAEKMWEQAIEIIKQQLGPDHTAVEYGLRNLLECEQKANETEKAADTNAYLKSIQERYLRSIQTARDPTKLQAGPVRVTFQGVTLPPHIVLKRDPSYSKEARKRGLQGTVLLHIVIGVDGKPDQVDVMQPLGMGLDELAMAAVRTWLFEPGTKNGVAVRVAANVEVNFRLL